MMGEFQKQAAFLLLLACVTSLHGICQQSTYIRSDGQFHIIGLFPVHSRDTNELDINAVLWSEYFKYAIAKLNSQYPGRTLLGYELYDTCSDEPSPAVTSTAMDILLNSKYQQDSVLQCQCVSKNLPLYETIGIIGPHSSSNALYLSSLLSFERIALISYAATSVELASSQNFYRTVPSDENQARFIKDVLLKFNWTYVVTLATDDVYGRSGVGVLRDVLGSAGICISTALSFQEHKPSTVKTVVEVLKRQRYSKVVIFWALKQAKEAFFKYAAEQELQHFVWILSEASGVSDFYSGRDNKLLAGMFLSVVPENGRDEDFESYFLNLTNKDSNANTDSSWTKHLFHKHSIDKNNVTSRLGDLPIRFDFSRVGFISDAIASLFQAFKSYAQDQMPCDLTIPICTPLGVSDHNHFNEKYIKPVSFQSLNGETFTFNKQRETKTAKYDIFVTKKTAKEKVEVDFVKFIRWRSTREQTSNIIIANASLMRHFRNITSRCSEQCRPGFYPVFDEINSCCWVCVECSENQVKNQTGNSLCTACPLNTTPNTNRTFCIVLKEEFLTWFEWHAYGLYIIACVGIIFVCLIGITFKCYQETPIVRSSNVSLSIVQLVAHFLIFLSPLLFVGSKDTVQRCSARVYSTGLLFAVIICVSFVKVTHLLEVFNLKFILTKKEIIQQRTKETAILLLFLLVDVFIAIGMLHTHQMEVHLSKDIFLYKSFHKCNLLTHYLVQLAYLLFLQVVCAAQAFRGRKLPGRFNEAQYTFFAMFISTLLMAIGVPLTQSADNQKEENFVISILTIVTNFSIVVTLYGHKLRLIIFHPEENTLAVFQRDRMEKALNSSAARKLSRASNVEWKVNEGFTLNEITNVSATSTLTNSSVTTDDVDRQTPGNNSNQFFYENGYAFVETSS